MNHVAKWLARVRHSPRAVAKMLARMRKRAGTPTSGPREREFRAWAKRHQEKP